MVISFRSFVDDLNEAGIVRVRVGSIPTIHWDSTCLLRFAQLKFMADTGIDFYLARCLTYTFSKQQSIYEVVRYSIQNSPSAKAMCESHFLVLQFGKGEIHGGRRNWVLTNVLTKKCMSIMVKLHLHHTVIPPWIYRIPSELRSQARLGLPSTVVGDHTGIVSAVCFL